MDQHYFQGYLWNNPDFDNSRVFLSPLTFECLACGKVTELFDSGIHGYDVELCHGATTMRGEGKLAVYECDECG